LLGPWPAGLDLAGRRARLSHGSEWAEAAAGALPRQGSGFPRLRVAAATGGRVVVGPTKGCMHMARELITLPAFPHPALAPTPSLCQEGLAQVCLVGSSTTLVRAKIEANLPR
jgi:hypothetical protein